MFTSSGTTGGRGGGGDAKTIISPNTSFGDVIINVCYLCVQVCGVWTSVYYPVWEIMVCYTCTCKCCYLFIQVCGVWTSVYSVWEVTTATAMEPRPLT